MNSFGMPAEIAGKLSKWVELKDPDKHDSVLSLFRNYGFSDTQIYRTVRSFPHVLLLNPEHTLSPKLKYLHSVGFSPSEIPGLVSSNPTLLIFSLEKRIIPHYEALKGVLGDDWKVRKCLKNSRWNACSYGVMNIVPNVKVLRDEGVPQSSVFTLLSRGANIAFMNQSKFVECVNSVKEIGIEPFTRVFVDALVVITMLNKSTWELKLDIFERCGWSRDVTLLAFSKVPRIMFFSEQKSQAT
ncbi:uncharacterized protein LOC114711659 [Neltuma alba]|uniref:uncharacterized protein LOC114711659 n=1 Tax=Neltuma alba TaxID=207710 RepID=UPI0010A2A9F9|nr:uncharacterized protein LOC114711659 [Prosopis alba]